MKKIIYCVIVLFLLLNMFNFSYCASANWTLNFNYNNRDYLLNLSGEFYNFNEEFDGNTKEGNFFIVADNNGNIYRILMYQKYRMGDYFTCSLNSDILTVFPQNNDCLFQYRYTNQLIWVNSSRDGISFNINDYKIIFSTCDIRYEDGSVYFKNSIQEKIDFQISLSNTDYTSEPIVAYTNYFSMDLLNKYKVYISTDMVEWNLMNYSTLTNAETGVTEFRFNYKIFENGVYYFKFLDLESNESEYITYTITTILDNRVEENNSDNIPIVHANYKKCYRNEEELFHIYTQGFSISDIQKYECYYIKDHFTTNYSVWNKMDLSSLYDVEKDETTYHFYFHTPIDSENCTYYFVLYDYEKNEYGGYSTLKCDFNYMNMYVNDNFVDSDLNADTIEDNKTIGFYRQTNIYKFFKNHFGLLFFPVDMTFEFFERLSLIKEESPSISVPTVYEPFTRWSIN